MFGAEVREGEILWKPPSELSRKSILRNYMSWLNRDCSYGELWKWSVRELEAFWKTVMDYFAVIHEGECRTVLESRKMPASGWFRGLRLNYTENIFRHGCEGNAVVATTEEQRIVLTWQSLEKQVHALANRMRAAGIGSGDRVAFYGTNGIPALVSMLASAMIGAIFSSCSQDMGIRSVLDRFRQIEPKAFIACRSYTYGGKKFDRMETILKIRDALPSISLFVVEGETDTGEHWEDMVHWDGKGEYERVDFEHPIWILYSSGTTGLPKAIVHGHGGILLEHLKLLGLHHDVKRGEKFFWYTTTGWMMWNVLASSLLMGATAVLYDGSALYPDAMALWDFAAKEKISTMGVSASFVNACIKAGIDPGQALRLDSIKSVAYTGSPLQPSGFAWLYRHVKEDLWVQGISGGTDVCTAFLCGSPILPVKAGMMQCRALGACVEAYDGKGQPVIGEVGELVLTEPLPSMPIYFWNDAGNVRYMEAYFSYFPGVWRHGDWVKIDEDGSAAIYGRSDATLKKHGVRMGTSELYACVEDISWVNEALVVGLELDTGYFMPLFVSVKEGNLTEERKDEIRRKIRKELSPRYVPDEIFQVPQIPKTLNGKKLELPVKRLLSGESLEKALNIDSVSNPESLNAFIEMRGMVDKRRHIA